MITIPNYSKIIEQNGASFLFDATAYSSLCSRVDELQGVFDGIKELLQTNNYPATHEWIKAIAEGGADSVSRLMVQQNDAEAKRLKVPPYIARQWAKSIIDDAPKGFFNDADALLAKLQAIKDSGITITDDDITFSEGRFIVDADAIKERIKPSTMRPISKQLQGEAQELRGLIGKLRTLQEGGLWVLDACKVLMGNWLAPSKYPDINDDIYLYNLLLQRRHNSRETIKAQSPEWYYLNGGE